MVKELRFMVEAVIETSKVIDGKTSFKIVNEDEKDLKLELKATFKKDVPTEWLKIFGRAGDEILVTINAKNRQTTLEE